MKFSTQSGQDCPADGDMSYEEARLKYPCLLISGESVKKKCNVKCNVILTKPDGKGGYTEEVKANGAIREKICFSCRELYIRF